MISLIDGLQLQKEHVALLKKRLVNISRQLKVVGIAFNDNPATSTYLKLKEKKALDLGIEYEIITLKGENQTTAECLKIIHQLNQDDSINGIWVQLPIPQTFDKFAILKSIEPTKDIDGLNPDLLGQIALGVELVLPATIRAVLSIILSQQINLKGQRVLVVGASSWLGQPMALKLSQMGASVTLVWETEKNLSDLVKTADLMISCTGVAGLVKGGWLREGAFGIDVGFCKVNNQICGDFDLESVGDKNITITPVPGGVGPMTVISLYENLIDLISE